MKKLLFGDDYIYSDRKEYHLTRKALNDSLDKNEECLSIFINIFFSGWWEWFYYFMLLWLQHKKIIILLKIFTIIFDLSAVT